MRTKENRQKSSRNRLSAVLSLARRRARGRRGFAVMAVIFGFLAFGVLVMAVLNMSATSEREVVSTNQSLNAYYLAESGFRVASEYYLNTGDEDNDDSFDDDKAAVLENDLDSKTFTVPGKGSVDLQIYPYWLVCVDGSGQGRSAKYPGRVPEGLTGLPGTGNLLYINPEDNERYNIPFTNGGLSGRTFSYRTQSGARSASAGDSLYFYLTPVSGTTSVSTNGNLSLTLPASYSGNMFPEFNGLIQFDNLTLPNLDYDNNYYVYTKASLSGNVLTLQNLRRVNGEAFTRDRLSTAARVVFKKFIILQSRGAAGSEERTLRYHTPVQDSRPSPPDIVHTPVNEADWNAAFLPSDRQGMSSSEISEAQTSGGTTRIFAKMNALNTQSGSGGGNNYKYGTFWYSNKTKINNFWNLGGYILNYDIQAKMATGKSLDNVAIGLSVRGRKVSGQGAPDAFIGVSFMQYALPTIYFQNGTKSGPVPAVVQPGWLIQGMSSGATGTVQGDPLVTSGSWDASTVRGSLRLTNVSGTFSQGEWLRVVGHTTNFARIRNVTGAYVPAVNDYIPDVIKPKPADFSPAKYDIGPFLLVLWERTTGGTWRWLAYKDITEDLYARGLQDWNENETCSYSDYPPCGPPYHASTGTPYKYDGQIVNDVATLLLRVREKRETSGVKYNEINVFYGDASMRYPASSGNAVSYDIMNNRRRYLPGSAFPTWPYQRLSSWSSSIDYFTHIELPSTGDTSFQWDAVNPGVSISPYFEMLDDGTIRMSELTTVEPAPTAPCRTTGNCEYMQNEVGLHAFGDIWRRSSGSFSQRYYGTAEFTDFALRFFFLDAQRYGGFLQPYIQ